MTEMNPHKIVPVTLLFVCEEAILPHISLVKRYVLIFAEKGKCLFFNSKIFLIQLLGKPLLGMCKSWARGDDSAFKGAVCSPRGTGVWIYNTHMVAHNSW